jgi:hypothetical protein
MEAPPSLVRLALGGLLLDPTAYRAQRESPVGMRRGLILVLLIGLLVGVAALIGDVGELLTQPDPQAVSDTLRSGLTAMPWYEQAVEATPGFADAFEQFFAQIGGLSFTPTPLGSALGVLTTPLVAVISWFIGGAMVHLIARAFGGTGRFGQTLAATALASSANLLGLVQVVPYAEVFPGALLLAGLLLGLLCSYVAVRETHGLASWRAFWAVTLGPLLLSLLLLALYCCVVFVFAGAFGSFVQGVGQ